MATAAAQITQETDLDSELTEFLGYSLKRALSIVYADLGRVLSEFDLRAVSFSALSVVVSQPGLTQTQLAEILQIERSNLVTIIDELACRNLILRAPVAHDRRRHAMMPTPAGKKLAATVHTRVRAHEDEVFAGITLAERAELQRILNKFRKSALG
jgi:DNA-binding MarR family transcriptional regulator